jgi:hypothetical protein
MRNRNLTKLIIIALLIVVGFVVFFRPSLINYPYYSDLFVVLTVGSVALFLWFMPFESAEDINPPLQQENNQNPISTIPIPTNLINDSKNNSLFERSIENEISRALGVDSLTLTVELPEKPMKIFGKTMKVSGKINLKEKRKDTTQQILPVSETPPKTNTSIKIGNIEIPIKPKEEEK